jgi:hypothetical protein
VTLTYRHDGQWQAGHISEFWHRVRQWYTRQGVELTALWTAELTGRGRLHYHALIWIPRHLLLPSPDRRGWWPHGSTRTEVARNAVGYIAKYSSKGTGGRCDPQSGDPYNFPRNCRISGGTKLREAQGVEWRYWTAPRWARERCEGVTDLRRVSGGVVVVESGELLQSPWRFVGLSPDGKFLQFEPRGV